MANLIEYIQSQVYENSTEDISGSIMQQVLTRMASDEGVVNVHTISGQTPFADYNNAQAARDAVPAGFKKLGLIITYKLSSGWYVDEFIGSATSGWSTASNWKCLGPISVSQNASTGKTTITIGSQSYDVATQPVSVSQNTNTGHTDITVGSKTTPVASVEDIEKSENGLNDIAQKNYVDITTGFSDVISNASISEEGAIVSNAYSMAVRVYHFNEPKTIRLKVLENNGIASILSTIPAIGESGDIVFYEVSAGTKIEIALQSDKYLCVAYRDANRYKTEVDDVQYALSNLDNTPTKNSNNPVKSGGVYDSVPFPINGKMVDNDNILFIQPLAESSYILAYSRFLPSGTYKIKIWGDSYAVYNKGLMCTEIDSAGSEHQIGSISADFQYHSITKTYDGVLMFNMTSAMKNALIADTTIHIEILSSIGEVLANFVNTTKTYGFKVKHYYGTYEFRTVGQKGRNNEKDSNDFNCLKVPVTEDIERITIIQMSNSQYGLPYYFLDANDILLYISSTQNSVTQVQINKADIPSGARWLYMNTLRAQTDGLCIVEYNNNSSSKSELNKLYQKNVLMFGNYMTEYKDNAFGIADLMSLSSRANVISGGIGGSHLSRRTSVSETVTTSTQAYANTDVPSIVDALVTGDWTYVDAGVAWQEEYGSDDNTEIINRLKALDFSKVDILTIFAGTNDWTSYVTMGVQSDTTEINNIYGAINYIVSTILTAYPKMKIYFITPIPRMIDKDTAKWSDSYVHPNSNVTLAQLSETIKNASKTNHVPVCDMYWECGINIVNCLDILTDGTHAYQGFDRLSSIIENFILSH